MRDQKCSTDAHEAAAITILARINHVKRWLLEVDFVAAAASVGHTRRYRQGERTHVLDGALAGDDGLHEEAEHREHGQAAVLDLLHLQHTDGERRSASTRRIDLQG